MSSIQIGPARIVVVAIGLLVAVLVFITGQHSVSGPASASADQAVSADGVSQRARVDAQRSVVGLVSDGPQSRSSSYRSWQAIAAERTIATTGVAGRLRAALGDGFGGVWFEPATARLHVGVTSASSRRLAEWVAADLGLADLIVETGVDSSWAELQAAQDRWDLRLSDLLEGGEASTTLAPDFNSLDVELGSAVPAQRRAELQRAAAAEDVAVSVMVQPYPDLGFEAQARCKEFAVGEAFCDPTLVAGVTFDSEKNEEGGRLQTCTAGPTVLPKDRTKAADATKTYVLTAGHCIENAGGVGKKWFAYNKEGEEKGEKEVGPATAFLNAETDVGVVEVKTTYWAKAKDFVPVVPTIAPWNKAEPEPFAVIAQREPVKNTKSCISGQKAGISCGEIINLEQTIEVEEVVTKNLIEVEGAETFKGDSGGPWFSKAKFEEETPTGYVEGTHVGFKGENAVFQSLKTSFEKLKNEKALDLELLTKTNEKRHPFKFATEAAPTVLTGKPHAGPTVFFFDAGPVFCANVTYAGEMTETGTIERSLTPTFAGCEFGGAPAVVDVNGCQYKLTPVAKEGANFEGSLDVACPEGKKITITGAGCTITIGSQSELKTVTYTNVGAGATRELTIDFNAAPIAYEEHSQAPLLKCATNTVPTFGGFLGGSTLITGETAAKAHRGIWVE
jgi:hypothetical protein